MWVFAVLCFHAGCWLGEFCLYEGGGLSSAQGWSAASISGERFATTVPVMVCGIGTT